MKVKRCPTSASVRGARPCPEQTLCGDPARLRRLTNTLRSVAGRPAAASVSQRAILRHRPPRRRRTRATTSSTPSPATWTAAGGRMPTLVHVQPRARCRVLGVRAHGPPGDLCVCCVVDSGHLIGVFRVRLLVSRLLAAPAGLALTSVRSQPIGGCDSHSQHSTRRATSNNTAGTFHLPSLYFSLYLDS